MEIIGLMGGAYIAVRLIDLIAERAQLRGLQGAVPAFAVAALAFVLLAMAVLLGVG